MAWSYDKFEEQMGAYWSVTNARNDKLLKVFFTIFGMAILIVVLLVTCVIPKPLALSGLMVVLVAFGLLAAYITFTARKFHRANGVFCPQCGGSLISLGEVLEDHTEDGIEYPETLECHKCHHIVISK